MTVRGVVCWPSYLSSYVGSSWQIPLPRQNLSNSPLSGQRWSGVFKFREGLSSGLGLL